jgi:hypothetical protein
MWREFVTGGAAFVVAAHGGGLMSASEAGPPQGMTDALAVVACPGTASRQEPADLCQAERDEERSVSAAPFASSAWTAKSERKAWASMARVTCRYQPG